MKLSPQNMLRIQLLISALPFFMLGGNGQVQVFGPDAYDLFLTCYKIFSVMKYMNLLP